jgi:hypothetical protein
MARFETSGLDDIIDQVTALGLGESEVADKMLLAGAEADRLAWHKAADKHGIKRQTGQMIDSVGYPRKPKTVDDIRQIDIYPQGMRKARPRKRKGGNFKPVRNAEIAFVLHYGSSKIKATHWVDTADELAAQPVQEAMEQVFDDYLKEKGMTDN